MIPPAPFAAALLAWFDVHRRDLPWRRTRDPYAIWLSEVMLQQTTVAAVRPRWERFLARWPTVAALAAAPLDDVLHEWTGLGYYARARNFHAAAGVIASRHGGRFPADLDALRALPGLGEYTAAAVASIAFGQPAAVIDANVIRVAARLLALEGDPRGGAPRRALRQGVEALLDRQHPGDFNQAMMELGSLVCTPRSPACDACPVADYCAAHRAGREEDFPQLAPKAAMAEVHEAAALLRGPGGGVLLLRRAPTGSFASMWETPRTVMAPGEDSLAAAMRAARDLAGVEPTPPADPAPAWTHRHTVMRQRIQLHVHVFPDWTGAPHAATVAHAQWCLADDEAWRALPKSTTQERLRKWVAGGVAS